MSKPVTTTPPLTIITICYNVETTIVPTLHSLAEQRSQSFEYFVIDGASQDKALSLTQILYPRAIVYSEPDHGLYDIMNKGLRQAHGTYAWYLNADDTLRTSDTVRTVRAAPETYQSNLLYGDTMIVDGVYQDLYPRRLRPPHRLMQRSFINDMPIYHQAPIPRCLLAPLYDLCYHYSVDYDWCIGTVSAIHSQCHIDDHLVNYLDGRVTVRNH